MKKLLYFFALYFFYCCKHPENEQEQFVNDENSVDFTQTKPQKKSIANYNKIQMEDANGVKYIWVEINGIKLRFVFDTGASSVCISSIEANLLFKQGTLDEDDIIESQYFQDATGKISQGTKINLKTIKIGTLTLTNIEATVIDNVNAPLLLGQTVFEKFGKIEIDNINNEIILK